MKKTIEKVLTSDWHLRLTPPQCWVGTDAEWMDYQRQTLAFIYGLGGEVYIAGDLFDASRPAIATLNLFLDFALFHPTFVMHGNHEEGKGIGEAAFSETAVGTLLRIAKTSPMLRTDMGEFHYIPSGGEEIIKGDDTFEFLFIHTGVTKEQNPFYGQPAIMIMNKYPEYKFIVAGDNHSAFTETNERGQTLINPGCISCQRQDMVGKPLSVYVQYSDGTIDQVFLPQSSLYSAEAVKEVKTDEFSILIGSLAAEDEKFEFDIKAALLDEMKKTPLAPATVSAIERIYPKLIKE